MALRRPLELRDLDARALDALPKDSPAIMPLEDARASVLLRSAGDDRLWPSPRLAEMAADRLRHARRVEHHSYEGAGHLLMFPCLPTTIHSGTPPNGGFAMELGGDPRAHAHAQADAWHRCVAFLRSTLDG